MHFVALVCVAILLFLKLEQYNIVYSIKLMDMSQFKGHFVDCENMCENLPEIQ